MPLYRICLYFAFFRYLAIGRVVKCVEDERLRKLLKAAKMCIRDRFYAVYGLGEWKNKHTVEK